MATQRVANDYLAWLDEATRVRDVAFRLAHDRFIKEVEAAAQLVGCNDPDSLALQVEYADKLMADYLAESDKLFESMSKLAQDGSLEQSRLQHPERAKANLNTSH